MTHNIIIKHSNWEDGDINLFFAGVDEELTHDDIHFSDATTIEELMVELGHFPSNGQSRKAGRHGPIPVGFTKFKAGKKRWIWILNMV